MSIAIITDSTCDIRKEELESLNIQRVPLYVRFKGEMYKDWLEISPKDIVEGVQGGADLPTTSQPSPQEFEDAFKEAVAKGATEIICVTISSGLSGTFQSANIAKENIEVPVHVFDSMTASIGVANMLKRAVRLRDNGASSDDILKELAYRRDNDKLMFTVASLEFLQKGGRIGRASAMVGSLLNIKPILTVVDGKVEPLARARGMKKALAEMVNQVKAYQEKYAGKKLEIGFLHVQDEEAAQKICQTMLDAGLEFENTGVYEIGAVIATHVGPGTVGIALHPESD